jgi:hypothetical protein
MGIHPMGRKDSLNCLEKRDLLNQPAVSLKEVLHWGQHYEEREFVHDAVDFYVKANAKEPLARLLDVAQAEGDVFLFRRLCRALEREPTQEEWLSLAKRAEELGKDSFAKEAYREGGIEE